MDCVTELALRRAGAGSLSEFQSREGIAATGEMDARTREALAPYALGYQVVRVRRGDHCRLSTSSPRSMQRPPITSCSSTRCTHTRSSSAWRRRTRAASRC